MRGTLTEAGTGTRLEGALVALVEPLEDSAYTRVLSDALGAFSLSALPGRWRLRAELIGHRTVYTEPFELDAQSDLVLDMSVPVQAVTLRGLDVRAAKRRCVVRPADEALATARLWEQARRALENAFVGQERDLVRFETEVYERDLDAETLEVEHEAREALRAVGPRPFAGATPESLARHGFVQTTDSGTYYFGPDERVLLSDVFLDDHCFRLHESAEDGDLLGLGFEPVRGPDRVDVKGVLWIDRETQELRSLEYEYVNLDIGVPTDRLGGGARFQRLPNGLWMPRRWWIRMPVVEIRRTHLFGRQRDRFVLSGIRERGAEVVSVQSGRVRLENLDRPRVQGMVYDSVLGAPLDGARIFLVGTGHETRTDDRGRFVLSAPEGDFSLAVRHPRLDTLGVRLPPVPVAMRPEVARRVRLAVPSAETLLLQDCAASGGSPVVTGRVRDASGRPLAMARVTMGWPASDRPERWRSASSDTRGRFAFCGAPGGSRVLVRAAHRERTSATMVVEVAADGVAQANLSVDLSTGRLAGRVTDATTGQPLPQASVRVLGTGQETLTDPDGEFVLAEVPPGHQLLEVGHFLYGDQSRALEVRTDSAVWLGVSLADGAIELEPITITVEANRTPGLTGFHERAERGDGFFLTEERIARIQAVQMSDVFNAVPGLTVACGDPSVLGSGCEIRFERARALGGRCPVQYFLDGSAASREIIEILSPRSLAGVEVYNGLSDVPPLFRRGPDTRCGVIAVWLKARR